MALLPKSKELDMYRTGMLPPPAVQQIVERRRFRTSDLYRRAIEIRREREAREPKTPLSEPFAPLPAGPDMPLQTQTQ
jgi:hypothetical protein